jgi:hypothetical protein
MVPAHIDQGQHLMPFRYDTDGLFRHINRPVEIRAVQKCHVDQQLCAFTSARRRPKLFADGHSASENPCGDPPALETFLIIV